MREQNCDHVIGWFASGGYDEPALLAYQSLTGLWDAYTNNLQRFSFCPRCGAALNELHAETERLRQQDEEIRNNEL